MKIKVKTLDTAAANEDMKIDIQSDCMTLADAHPATAGNIKELDVVEGNTDELRQAICQGICQPITIRDVLYNLDVNLFTCLCMPSTNGTCTSSFQSHILHQKTSK